MNVKEYASKMRVSARTVYDWIQKGYLPDVKDPETGKINIPEDMPRPYKTNGKIKRVEKLTEAIIEAADLQQTVYHEMFPLVREDTFGRTIDSLVESQIISKQRSSTGVVFYELRPIWRVAEPAEKKTVLETIVKAINTGASVVQIVEFVITVWPVVIPLLQQAANMLSY